MHETVSDLLVIFVHLSIHLVSKEPLPPLSRLLALHPKFMRIIRSIVFFKVVGNASASLVLLATGIKQLMLRQLVILRCAMQQNALRGETWLALILIEHILGVFGINLRQMLIILLLNSEIGIALLLGLR